MLSLATPVALFGHRSGYGYGPRGGWLFALVPLLGFGLIAALVAATVLLLVRRPPVVGTGGPSGWSGQRPDPALDIARARYARGELSRDEFLRIARDLGAPFPPEPAAEAPPPSPPAG